MDRDARSLQRAKDLGSESIGKLLIRLSVPATTGMIVMALYNLVDTIFVGRGVGALAIGGLSIVMPIQMLIFSSTQTLGMGGASLISRSLGANDHSRADLTFGNLISMTFLLGAGVLLAGYLFPKGILFLFGAQGEILPYARDYFMIILLGTPFLSYAMVFNNILRAEGNAKTAMLTMIIAAVINMILDPIFIFGFHWGVKGAAWASVISQFITFLYLIWHFGSGKSALRFRRRDLKLNLPVVKEVLAVGASSLGRHGAGSILAAILNHILYAYGGPFAVAVYGIINRVLRVVFMPLIGLVQGFLPICGYNYGAHNYHRVWALLKVAVRWITEISIVLYILLMIFTRSVIGVFTTNQEVIDMGVYAFRLIILLTPIVGFQLISASYFQAIGKALPSFILAISRQILLLLPLLLILPKFWGLNGVWFSFPLSDSAAVLITLIMIWPEVRWLRKKVSSAHETSVAGVE